MTVSRGAARQRTVIWHNPASTSAAGLTMSGIEYLLAMQQRQLPPPPIAGLMQMELCGVEHPSGGRFVTPEVAVPVRGKKTGVQSHSAGLRIASAAPEPRRSAAPIMMLVALTTDIVVAPSLIPILMWSALTGGGALEFASSGVMMALLVLAHVTYRIIRIRSNYPPLQGS